MVNTRAHADAKGHDSRRKTERDLERAEAVSLAPTGQRGGSDRAECTETKNIGKGPTRSARESSSWPIMLLFFLHRATLPSMKSKKSPRGRNPNAAQRFPTDDASPRQYRRDEKIDIAPHNPTRALLCQLWVCCTNRSGSLIPLSSVMKSARCKARISEKWPASDDRRSFCLS